MTDTTSIFWAAIFISIFSSSLTAFLINWYKKGKPPFGESENDEFQKLGESTDRLWGVLIKRNDFNKNQKYFAAAIPDLRETDRTMFSYVIDNSSTTELSELNRFVHVAGMTEVMDSEIEDAPSPIIMKAINKANFTLEKAIEGRKVLGKIIPLIHVKQRILENITNLSTSKDNSEEKA